MEVKTLHDHLVKGHVSALEKALNLKESVGFGNAYYDFDESNWDESVEGLNADEQYREFLATACSYPSLVGTVEDNDNRLKQITTIILYKGFYRVQVETKNNKIFSTEYSTKEFNDYLKALRFAYGVVKEGE